MRNYKFHEYIDAWMKQVESGEVQTCKEQKQLMDLVKKVLDDKNVYIDHTRILNW